MLEALDVPYAIGGSVASIAYGEPRATLDIDVVVDLDAPDIARLMDHLDPDVFHLDAEQAADAVARKGQFNVIVPKAGLKIDFFVAGDEIELRQIADRRRLPALPDLDANFSPPEELILKKLQYFAAGGSDKHLRDIAAMLAISPEEIDRTDIATRAADLGLSDSWHVVSADDGGTR